MWGASDAIVPIVFTPAFPLHMSEPRYGIRHLTSLRPLLAGVALLLSLAPHASAADGKISVRYKVYWEGSPPRELVRKVFVCLNDGGNQTAISPATSEPHYFWQHASNLLSSLSVHGDSDVVVREERAIPEIFVVYVNSATFKLRRANHAVAGQIYDKKNYVNYVIDDANRKLAARSRPSLTEAEKSITHLRELQPDSPITAARLETTLITTLARFHSYTPEDSAWVDQWYQSTCMALKESHKPLVTEQFSSVLSAMAGARGKEWHDEGARILKRAIADSIEPRYGAGDLWEALITDGSYQRSYDIAHRASELLLERDNAENYRWFRRAVTSLQKMKRADPSADVKTPAEEIANLITQRSQIAGTNEKTLLQPLLREAQDLTR